MSDQQYMARVLELAKNGAGYTSPNPLVGSVIVKNNKIIGEGYHRQYGEKHAEVVAIETASEPVEGATLYCNLEPCCHSIPAKKTPPCTRRIIHEKISRVVIANKDPNPYVNGNGIRALRNNGIRVDLGILKKEAAFLNEKYFKFIHSGVPFIHLKIAQSLDGRIATSNGNSQWITNNSAIELVHKMRSEYDAILVGANTVLADNPSLTVRKVQGRNPYRIILDDHLQIPDHANLISDDMLHKTIIFTVQPSNHPKFEQLQKKEIQVISIPENSSGNTDLNIVLKRLSELNIASVLVEGGGKIFTSFVRKKLFDKISLFVAPLIIGAGIESIGDLGIKSLSEAFRLQHVKINIIDNQALVEGYRDLETIFNEELKED